MPIGTDDGDRGLVEPRRRNSPLRRGQPGLLLDRDPVPGRASRPGSAAMWRMSPTTPACAARCRMTRPLLSGWDWDLSAGLGQHTVDFFMERTVQPAAAGPRSPAAHQLPGRRMARTRLDRGRQRGRAAECRNGVAADHGVRHGSPQRTLRGHGGRRQFHLCRHAPRRAAGAGLRNRHQRLSGIPGTNRRGGVPDGSRPLAGSVGGPA